MTSPFTFMAATLGRLGHAGPAFPCAPRREPARISRTERIRELLRQRGPLSSAAIATELDLSTQGLVGALLKADLHAGRAFHQGGLYHWDHAFDEQLQREIAEAIHLLKKNGYSVERTRE